MLSGHEWPSLVGYKSIRCINIIMEFMTTHRSDKLNIIFDKQLRLFKAVTLSAVAPRVSMTLVRIYYRIHRSQRWVGCLKYESDYVEI